MERKGNNLILSALLRAFVFGMIPILFSLFNGVGWEANDDPAIAWFLSRGSNWSPFQSKILCYFFRILYRSFSSVEWWAVMTIVAIYASTVAFLYIIYRKRDSFFCLITTIVLLILIWLVSLRAINFTRTAFVVAMAGVVLVAQALFDKFNHKLCITEMIFGYLFLIYGTMIRRQCGILAIGYLALIGLFYLLKQSFKLKREWFRQHFSSIVILIIAPILVFGCIGLNQVLLSDEQASYVKYNNYRSAISDFHAQFPLWEDAEQEYNEIGLSYEGYYYFDDLSEDTDMFNIDKLEKLASMKNNTRNWKDIIKELKSVLTNDLYNSWQILYVIWVFQLVFMILYKYAIPIIVADNLYMGIIFIINAWISHFYARVFEPVAFGALVATIVFIDIECPRREWKKLHLNKMITSLLVLSLMGIVLIGQAIGKPVINNSSPWSKLNNLQDQREKYMDKINEDSGHVYLFPLGGAPVWWTSAYGFWEVQPKDYCLNMFCLGGWDARSPYNIERLKNYGIQNPMKALYEKANVYSIYSPVILDYLQKNYDSKITAAGDGFLDDCILTQYTASISNEKIEKASNRMRLDVEINYDNQTLYISGNMYGDYEDVQEVYCNVPILGTVYTYRIGLYGDWIFSQMYNAENYDEKKKLCFFAKLSNGKYVEIPCNVIRTN